MSIFIQIVVIILSLTARFMVGSKSNKTIKAGCIIGFFDEFAWVALFIVYHQYWMIILSVAYTYMWYRMLRNR